MSCLDVPIQTILGTECIGDSLPKINTNFSVLGDAACDLYAKVNQLSSVPAVDATVNVVDSPTIDINWNASTRTLSAVTTASVATSSSPMVAKAWVSFNGTSTNGPATILNSYNVTSVIRNTSATYTVNLVSGLYSNRNQMIAVAGTCDDDLPDGSGGGQDTVSVLPQSTTEVYMRIFEGDQNPGNNFYNSLVLF